MTKTLEGALEISPHRDRQPAMVGFTKYIMMQVFPRMKHSHPPFFEVIYDTSHRTLAYLVVHDGASPDKSLQNSLLLRLVNEQRQRDVGNAIEHWDVFEAQSLLALTDKIPFPHNRLARKDVPNPSNDVIAFLKRNTREESGDFVYVNHLQLKEIAAELRSSYAQHANEKISVEVVIPEGFSAIRDIRVQASVIPPPNAHRLRTCFEEILVKYKARERLNEVGAACMGLSLPGDWDFNCPAAYTVPTMNGYVTANVGINAGPPARAEKFIKSEKK